MQRRSIYDKPKKSKGTAIFLILLILAGFIVSVFLFGKDAISEIIHP